jgi:cell wall-associated NlpC family hydrolase
VASVTLAGALASYAAVAGAAPRPTISQVTAQVSKLTTAQDRAIQQYDQVNQQLVAANARLKLVDAELARDQAQFDSMRADIAQIAAAAYEDGNLTSIAALLTSANPQTVLTKASYLSQLSSNRYTALHQFLAVARQLSGAQQQAKRTQQAIAGLRAQRKAQAASIGRALNQKKALLATLTAQQAAAVVAQASAGSGGTTSRHRYTGPTGTQAQQAVAFAYNQLGCPYVYGAAGPCSAGYDCSGLVMAAWASAGVSIPRDTYAQWAALPHVPMSTIQPGDLIYFNGESHVGIYVGGNDIIDAPVPGASVEKVSLSEAWYAQTLDGAVRP